MRTYITTQITVYDINGKVSKQKYLEHINYKDIMRVLKVYAVYGDVGHIDIKVEKLPIDNKR